MSHSTEDLRGISGTDANNVWAAGAANFVKWDGTAWTSYLGGGTYDAPVSIWGADANNFWAVGKEGVIQRWNGKDWLVWKKDNTHNYFGVWGADANHVWLVGTAGTNFAGIQMWDGTAFVNNGYVTGKRLNGVWGLAANNVYIVGEEGIILHKTR